MKVFEDKSMKCKRLYEIEIEKLRELISEKLKTNEILS